MAFSGTGHRLGSAMPMADSDTAHVPTLVDCCLRVLERHIDMIEDIGVTPFHLIESVLRKCNVEQLSRIEHHTEGLCEFTDELWYLHAIGEFKSVRDEYPRYDQSGDWHSIYIQRRKDEDEKFARVGAKLRQSYSQHDKNRQGRQVSFDPNLRLPKRGAGFRTGGSGPFSSGWGAPRRPKTLFEKAKLEAKRTIQMFTPFPQNRSAPPRSSSGSSSSSISHVGRIRPPSAPYTSSRYPVAAATASTVAAGQPPTGTRIPVSNTSTVLSSSSSSSSLANVSGTVQRSRPKYSYKTRPVVYTSLHGSAATSSISHPPPLSPAAARSGASKTMPLAPSIPIPANANGAIANFFKELNPSSVVPKKPSTRSRSPSPTITSTRHVRSTGGGGGSGSRESRSPTSPFQPASKTMEALRPHQDDEYRMQRQAAQVTSRATKGSSHSGGTLKDLAKSGRKDDYRWLEEDDDDDDEGMDKDMGGGYRDKSHDHMRRKYHHDSEDERAEVTRPPRKRRIEQGSDDTTILSPSASLPSSTDSNHNNNGHQPIMKPMTLEAAGRQFFDQLLGK